jgi:hypothetical protein
MLLLNNKVVHPKINDSEKESKRGWPMVSLLCYIAAVMGQVSTPFDL